MKNTEGSGNERRDEKTTGELLHILKGTHSEKELNEYIERHTQPDQEMSFAARFSDLLERKGRSKSDVIRKSLVERTYGYQILSGKKNAGRDYILALCIAAELTLRETQSMLEGAKAGILYSRSTRDAIIIYGIEHNMSVMDLNELLNVKGEKTLFSEAEE